MQLTSLYHVNDAFREVRDVVNLRLFDNYSCKAADSLSVTSISHNTAEKLIGVSSQKTGEFRHWVNRLIDTSADQIVYQQAQINFHAPETNIDYEGLNLIKSKSNLFY